MAWLWPPFTTTVPKGPAALPILVTNQQILTAVNQIRASQLGDERTAANNQAQLVADMAQLLDNQRSLLSNLATTQQELATIQQTITRGLSGLAALQQTVAVDQRQTVVLLNQIIEILQGKPTQIVGDPESVVEVPQPLPPR